MSSARRTIVSVIGGSEVSSSVEAEAEALGRGLVEAGYRVANGGRGGVMAAVSRGARSAAVYREGDVLGILPGLDPDEANPWVDIAVPTGLNLARNVVLVNLADAVVAVGGGSGTLSEMALAWQLGRPVVALCGSGGWADRLAGESLDARRSDVVHSARDAREALQRLSAILAVPHPRFGGFR